MPAPTDALPWLAYALSATATWCAWAVVAQRARGHIPAALLLSTGLATDLLRRALSVAVLTPAHAALSAAPLPRALLWAVAVEVTAQLAYPAAVACAALAVWSRRRAWWPVVGAWAGLSAALVLAYPTVRGDALATVYRVAHGAAALVAAVAFAQWARHRQPMTCAGRVCLFTTAAEVVGVIVPWGRAFTSWDLARVVYSTLYAVLITVQLRDLWTPPRSLP